MLPGNSPLTPSGADKEVRPQYRLQIYLVILANSVFLYGIAKTNSISVDGLRGLFSGWHDLIPISFAFVIATVVNGILSDEMKDRLVFFRWKYALPGHAAFSLHAKDSRISMARLKLAIGGPVPVDPAEQNSKWYEIYLSLRTDAAVADTNRSFMLTRDYAGLSALSVLIYGAIGFWVIPSRRVEGVYLLVLICQYAVVRQAAANYGVALVRRVLARAAALSPNEAVSS